MTRFVDIAHGIGWNTYTGLLCTWGILSYAFDVFYLLRAWCILSYAPDVFYLMRLTYFILCSVDVFSS